jgi:hypothetical protein
MSDFKIELQNKELVKTIEISGSGEVITLDFGDNEFMKKLYEFENLAYEMKNMDKEKFNFDDLMKNIYLIINDLFGKNSVKKIFGKENPSFIPVFDFITKLMDFVAGQIKNNFGKNLNRQQKRLNARGGNLYV